MDEFFFILLGLLVVIGLPTLAIAAFVMVLGLRRRVTLLERRLGLAPGAPLPIVEPASEDGEPVVASVVPPMTPPVTPPSAVEPTPPSVVDATAPTPQTEPAFASEAAPADAPTPAPDPATAAARQASLEEMLGARWTVWVGGIALALGGVFLVRYSIEAGLIGPGARILAGLVFALGLVAGGEVLRRRERRDGMAGPMNAHIPGVLTAAGTVALFGTIYAAHALYGFIGAGTAFVALGLVGVATMVAAALHGPWLAGLGLVGAYATPLLVSSQSPNPWALTIYLAVVTGAAFTLARLRLWRWLAITATLAALLWGLILATELGADRLPAIVHLLVLASLVIGILGLESHRGDGNDAPFDVFALAAMLGVAGLALVVAMVDGHGGLTVATALIVAGALLLAALAVPALAPAGLIAALLAIGLAATWPVVAQSLAEPLRVIPDLVEFPSLMPDAAFLYATLLALAAAALFAGTTLTIERRPTLPLAPAIAWALAGVAGPLFLLAIAYVRLTAFTANLTFGALGLGLAALLAASTARFLAREHGENGPAMGAAASIHAAAATSALALALTMTLAGSTLTLAFALSALGTSWVALKRPMAALRWCAVGLTALVLLRSGGSWTVIGAVMTTFPDWSEIALRFALPALAIGLGGYLLRRRATDAPAAFLDGAAILLATAAGCLAIRLAIQGQDEALYGYTGLLETGLYVAMFLAMAIGFARGARMSGSIVHRIAAPASAVLALALAAGGLLILRNPIITGDTIPGSLFFNALTPSLAGTAVLCAILRRVWAGMADQAPGSDLARPIALAAGIGATLLAFLYVTAQTRFAMRDGDMMVYDVTTAESYAYSVVWLGFGVALLAGGLLFASKGARAASAVVILLTVAKVFLVDMSDLEGAWRALSFIGLGLALIGIGLVYQRLLFSGRGSKAPPQTPPSAGA
ncbi:MAG: DUF2339 domain-containing protein [Labrys sp. (in: a-proteobacteria)]